MLWHSTTQKKVTDGIVKVLGIQWNRGRDVMFFKTTEIDFSIVPTKWELLSQLGIAELIPVHEKWTALIHGEEPISGALNARRRSLVEDLLHPYKTFNYPNLQTDPRTRSLL